MNTKVDNAEFWGAHACSVLVAAFCGDELLLNTVARAVVSFAQSSRRQDAFAGTLQACAPQKITCNATMK
jgi:hypothetical protein